MQFAIGPGVSGVRWPMDKLCSYLCKVISVAGDDTRHEVVMTTEVLRCAVINDVRAVFERALEVRAHHGVVHNDGGVWALLLDHGAYSRNVDDLQERVRRCLEQHHGNLGREIGYDGGRVGGIDMVHLDAYVCAEVGEETVCTAVDIVACDELVARLEDARDDIQASHA